MKIKEREALLKTGAIVAVALLILNYAVLPIIAEHWETQGAHIASLRKKVEDGENLLSRAPVLRARWADMQHADLPPDSSDAESDVQKAMSRWARESRLNFTSLNPQWRSHEEGYDTYECRATATGDQASLGRLLYEMETGDRPARIEDCELTTRDAHGQQLTLSLRFSFVRLVSTEKGNR